jgi:hypothetical protein
MASESINIDSIGGNSNLKAWASDVTQQKILKQLQSLSKLTQSQRDILSKFVKSNSQRAGSMSSAEAKELARLEKERIKRLKEDNEASKKNKKETEETGKSMGFLKGTAGLLAAAFSGLSYAIGKITGLFTESLDVYENMVKFGLMTEDSMYGLSGGISDLSKLSDAAGISIKTLEKASTGASRAVKLYGTGTFVNTVNDMKESMYGFGMTTNQFTEFLAADLEQQRRYGFITRLSEQDYQTRLARSTDTLFKFSKALGASYEELQQQANQATAGADFALFVRSMGVAGEKIQESANMVSYGFGENVGKQISTLAALDDALVQLNPTIQQLHQIGGTDLANSFISLSRKVRAGSITQENASQELSKFANNIKSIADPARLQQILSILGVQGSDASSALADLASVLQSGDILNNLDKSIAETKGMNDVLAETKKIQSKWNANIVRLQSLFIDQFDKIMNSKNAIDAINSILDGIYKLLGSDKLKGVVDKLFDTLLSGIDKLATIDFNKEIENFKTKWNNFTDVLSKGYDEFLKLYYSFKKYSPNETEQEKQDRLNFEKSYNEKRGIVKDEKTPLTYANDVLRNIPTYSLTQDWIKKLVSNTEETQNSAVEIAKTNKTPMSPLVSKMFDNKQNINSNSAISLVNSQYVPTKITSEPEKKALSKSNETDEKDKTSLMSEKQNEAKNNQLNTYNNETLKILASMDTKLTMLIDSMSNMNRTAGKTYNAMSNNTGLAT